MNILQVPAAIYDEALVFCNKLRAVDNQLPLLELPAGLALSSRSCPCGKTCENLNVFGRTWHQNIVSDLPFRNQCTHGDGPQRFVDFFDEHARALGETLPVRNHMTHRPISTIAQEIENKWRDAQGRSKVWFGAKPYLEAMFDLTTIDQNYGADSGKSIVLYFLANAATWRGEDARRIKAELKALLK